MDDEKNVRDMDRILLRVPDGLKSRLHQRSKANGRSMNSEIVSILTSVLDAPDEMGLRALREESRAIEAQIEETRYAITALRERREKIRMEIRARRQAAGEEVGGRGDPDSLPWLEQAD